MNRLLGRIADYIRETDKILLLLCMFAAGYGCIAVLSATHPTGSPRQFIMQAVSMLLGLAAAVFISNFDYKNIAKFWPVILAVGIIPVFLTFFIGFAPAGTDDKAWLTLPGGLTFQPAELFKVAFIITFSLHISLIGEKINQLRHLFLVCLHGVAPLILIHMQGDDGTAVIFAFMMVCMLFAAGLKLRYFAIAGGLAIGLLPVVWFFVMHDQQRARVVSLFNPESDLLGNGWQQWRGRIALANGGLFGKGLFRGPYVQSQNVPEGFNDFIFASIGEELGLIGCLAVVLLLIAICLRILRVGHIARDTMGSVICVGVFAMLVAQMIVNLGMCLSLLPVIGVTLPFFSAGGTSLVCLFLGMGLVLSVYMHRNSRTLYLRD